LAVDFPVHNPLRKFGRIPALQPNIEAATVFAAFGYVGDMKLAQEMFSNFFGLFSSGTDTSAFG
jgi:hypothetical protein